MIKIYEKFTESDYLKRKQKKEQRITQKLGDHYIEDIVADGDFEGLKYIQDKGFKLKSVGDEVENLLTIALQNNQMEMLDYLLNKSDYFEGSDWGGQSPINSISLPDIVLKGRINYDKPNKIHPKTIEWLKIITNLGYNFMSNYNLIELYLCENSYKITGENKTVLIQGLEPFIDWLLETHPENYTLCKDILPEYLKSKFKYLDEASKYNI